MEPLLIMNKMNNNISSCLSYLFFTFHLQGSVLGADDGLYVVSTKGGLSGKPAPIVGLGPVYQMEFLRDLDIALLIAGKERIFCYVDISSLESRLKQLQTGSSISAISAHQIEKVKGCHLFAVSKVTFPVLNSTVRNYFREKVLS